jgi:SAM-dependent methyltransferase
MAEVINQGSITQGGAIRDIIEWDIANWSRALEFWKRNTSKDLSTVNALEIGSRNGGLSLWIALQGGRCLCTDLDGPTPTAVKMHRKYDVSQRIQYGMLDAAEMTYDAQFDIVLFKSVLGGIGYGNNKPKQQKAMKAIYRTLKPGGELLFAENLMASPFHRFLRRHFVDWGEQWRYITLAELKQFTSDFAEVKHSTAGFIGDLGRTEGQRNFLGRLDKVFVERMVPQKWRYIAICVARK